MYNGLETRIPAWKGEDPWLFIQNHTPLPMEENHWHNHVEINWLENCSMVYISANQQIHVTPKRIALFWASIPHRVTKVEGSGRLTCVNILLQEFSRWHLPIRFRHEIMHGGFLLSLEEDPGDPSAFARWQQDCAQENPAFLRQALDEIQLRIRRMALTGWRLAGSEDTPARSPGSAMARGLVHVEAMINFIANHYHEPIKVEHVAKEVGLHPNYAMSLFKQVVGLPISTYLARHRLSHAQAMLLDTDEKVLAIGIECGFGSLSNFYATFQQYLHTTPGRYRTEWRA